MLPKISVMVVTIFSLINALKVDDPNRMLKMEFEWSIHRTPESTSMEAVVSGKCLGWFICKNSNFRLVEDLFNDVGYQDCFVNNLFFRFRF